MTAPGLYLHVPFCARACPYCDFDFEVGRTPDLQRYVDGLVAEMRRVERPSTAFDTVYWGGGTPSLLGPTGVETVFRAISPLVGGRPLVEFTVECNPEHVDAALLAGLASVGAGRVSLGVQSFAPKALSMLGRVHDARRAVEAVEAAKSLGFQVSVDLIVGWPGQSSAQLRRDLEHIVACEVDHVSTYALTVEEDTPWTGLIRRGKRQDVDPDHQARRLLEVEDVLCSNGFEHYEISSYARSGRRAVHNRKYWNGVDYLGLGPSAASARFSAAGEGVAVARWQNPRGLETWASGVEAEHEQLDPQQALGEALWLGLRQLDGVDLGRLAGRLGVSPQRVLERISRPLQRGDLVEAGGRVSLGPRRWLIADGIAAELLAPGGP